MKRMVESRMTMLGLALCTGFVLGLSAGCGGGSDDSSTAENDSKGETRKSGSSKSKAAKTVASTDGGRSRTIDGIPLDVFFDNPLGIAADDRTGGGTTVPDGDGADPEPPVQPAEEPKTSSTSTAVAWANLITVEELKGEVKSLRNEMQQRLGNVGAYKRSTLELPVFGTAMAFAGEVGMRVDGELSWKDKAKYVRVLAAKITEITSSSTAASKKSYDEVNGAFLTICEILDGNDPPGLPEVEDEIDFTEFADMGYLMKRLERGREWMQTNTGSEDGLNSKPKVAIREAAFLAAIAEAFKREDYGYADDDEFLGYLNSLQEAALEMKKGVTEKSFDQYDLSRSNASQKCDQCHGVYKNG